MLSDRLALVFPVFIVALLAALTLWLDQIVRTAPSSPTDGRNDPDFIVDNFVANQTGLDGLLKHTLRARRMTHFVFDDSTHLDQPRLTHFSEKRLDLRAESDSARLSSDGQEVLMSGNVRLTRAASGNQSELTLLTSSLLVIPDKGLARTDQPVVIRNATSNTEAVGLEFDYGRQHLTLLHDVRTSLKPSPQ